MPDGRRIVLVTNEILGLVRTGGAGTANTFLAFALATLGHEVSVLCTTTAGAPELDRRWANEYAERRIEVRLLESTPEQIVPRKLAVAYAVERALRVDPPDVVVAHDWAGPAYCALRARELGLGFAKTLFVVYCHGTQGWIYEAHRQVQRRATSFERQFMERASVELADAVVSPSAYMLGWMRARGWAVSRPIVAPYFTRSAVDSGTAAAPSGGVRRLAFFGRLEERKGIRPFLEALNGLDPELLSGVELVFLGKEGLQWSPERVEQSLSAAVKGAVSAVRFEADLDQPEAIAALKTPGTLAVMPSLVDNSPNVIYECIEHGIPFLAGNAGGGPELVTAEDRERAFVEPTPDGIRRGLEPVLSTRDGLVAARPGFAAEETRATWQHVVTSRPRRVFHESSSHEQVVVVKTRSDVDAATGELVLLTEEGDELDSDCVATLVRAQAASGADVVTCGIRRTVESREETQLFLGDPRELGILANYYGTIALYRRSALLQALGPEVRSHADWVRLASLALEGKRVVSVPWSLARSARAPGDIGDPSAADAVLAVVHAFERASGAELQSLPQLVAALAAEPPESTEAPSLRERLERVRRQEGVQGLLRRGAAKGSGLLNIRPRVSRSGVAGEEGLISVPPPREQRPSP